MILTTRYYIRPKDLADLVEGRTVYLQLQVEEGMYELTVDLSKVEKIDVRSNCSNPGMYVRLRVLSE